MDKVRELRLRATHCRESAGNASQPDIRARYDNIARMWDKLADERLVFFVEKPGAPEEQA